MKGQGMKGTNYVIGLFVYIASILLPIIVSSKAISYTHIALYAVFSLIIIAGATIDMHYYILPDEGALALVNLIKCYQRRYYYIWTSFD